MNQILKFLFRRYVGLEAVKGGAWKSGNMYDRIITLSNIKPTSVNKGVTSFKDILGTVIPPADL